MFSMQKLHILASSMLVAFATSAEMMHHDKHQHGVADVNIAISGNKVALDFDAPAFNIAGGMDKVHNSAFMATQVAKLSREESALFVFNETAKCRMQMVETHIASGHGHEEHAHEEHDHDDHEHDKKGGKHLNVAAEINYYCQQPEQLAEMSFEKLFTTFPAMERVNVNWVSATRQSSAVVTPDQVTVYFDGRY
jgi:hypothetical protein